MSSAEGGGARRLGSANATVYQHSSKTERQKIWECNSKTEQVKTMEQRKQIRDRSGTKTRITRWADKRVRGLFGSRVTGEKGKHATSTETEQGGEYVSSLSAINMAARNKLKTITANESRVFCGPTKKNTLARECAMMPRRRGGKGAGF